MTFMYSRILIVLVALAAQATSAAEPEAPLRLLTEHSPPGQYLDDNGQLSGVSVELLKLIQQRLAEPATMELMPWGRALSIARSDNNTGLFETVRTAERESWFKWVGPLLHYKISLYGIKQHLGNDAAETELPGKLIACSYRNTVTAEDIKRFGFTEHRNLVLTRRTGECLDLLILGRIHLMSITEYNLANYAAQVQAAGLELVPVRYLTERKRYLAFSPDVADKRVARWQKALEQSYRDGTMRSLYQPVYADVIIQRLEEFAAQQQ